MINDSADVYVLFSIIIYHLFIYKISLNCLIISTCALFDEAFTFNDDDSGGGGGAVAADDDDDGTGGVDNDGDDGIVWINCSCCIVIVISINANHEQDFFRLFLFWWR